METAFSSRVLRVFFVKKFMGATLPVLCRYIINRSDNIGWDLGTLYSINTFGGIIGCLVSGFYLIGSFGIHNTVYIAVALNVSVGLISLLLSIRNKSINSNPVPSSGIADMSPADKPDYADKSAFKMLMIVMALSGFTSFAYEIYWSRSLVFLLGNSTYAYVTMLTSFLLGIASGSFLVRYILDRLRNPLRLLAFLEIFIGISAALAMPLLIQLIYSDYNDNIFLYDSSDWGFKILFRFYASLIVMLIPATLIGATFPLVGKVFVNNLKNTGSKVGKIYSVNTLGNILGSFIPCFMILPLFGINKSIILMASVNICLGIYVLSYKFTKIPYILLILVLCTGFVLSSIPIPYQFPSDFQKPGDDTIFYKEGVTATTKVIVSKKTQYKYMSVDGVSIGSTDPGGDFKQQLLAHLPKLLMEKYDSELSIGLGSGILIGESAKHEGVKSIDCVEIAKSVIEGASYFSDENNDVLNNPKVNIINDDGFNYLLTNDGLYDVISSDAKTKPEHGSNGLFFARDYYAILKDHLSENGMVIQWVPMHYITKDIKMILKTFIDTFHYSYFWHFPNGNGILIGRKKELIVDYRRMNELLSDLSKPFNDLKQFDLTSANDILSYFIISGIRLSQRLDDVRVNSFEHPYIEFYSFFDYAQPVEIRQLMNLSLIGRLKDKIYSEPKVINITNQESESLRNSYQGERARIAMSIEKTKKDRMEKLKYEKAREMSQYYFSQDK